MSHNITNLPIAQGVVLPQLRFVQLTIVDYATGGELIAVSEIGANGVQGVFFSMCTVNSLGLILLPILVGGKILLAEDNAGTLQQIPTTVGLNAQISALAVVTN